MKRIVCGVLATLSGVVLLFSYRTSLGDGDPGAASSSGAVEATAAPAAAAAPSASGAPSAPSGGLVDGAYTGGAVDTRYGAVRVQITVSAGRISDVTVLDAPSGNGRDRQITAWAVPQLVSETLDAQSAHIDLVSGATYTSKGYLGSLQAALDAAASS